MSPKLTRTQEIERIRESIRYHEGCLRAVIVEQNQLDLEAKDIEMHLEALKIDLWDLEVEAEAGC